MGSGNFFLVFLTYAHPDKKSDTIYGIQGKSVLPAPGAMAWNSITFHWTCGMWKKELKRMGIRYCHINLQFSKGGMKKHLWTVMHMCVTIWLFQNPVIEGEPIPGSPFLLMHHPVFFHPIPEVIPWNASKHFLCSRLCNKNCFEFLN